uniref:Uncharacterized protein n=1 Tax=Oryza glumipatula TaxID=40148 RepID=A0A0E0ADG5_9ORYZ
MTLALKRDWLVYYGFNNDPQLIGRFPKSLFTSLVVKATEIWFGGMAITNNIYGSCPADTGETNQRQRRCPNPVNLTRSSDEPRETSVGHPQPSTARQRDGHARMHERPPRF